MVQRVQENPKASYRVENILHKYIVFLLKNFSPYTLTDLIYSNYIKMMKLPITLASLKPYTVSILMQLAFAKMLENMSRNMPLRY